MKPQTDLHKQNISNAKKGRPQSDEHKQNVKNAWKLKNEKKRQQLLANSQI